MQDLKCRQVEGNAVGRIVAERKPSRSPTLNLRTLSHPNSYSPLMCLFLPAPRGFPVPSRGISVARLLLPWLKPVTGTPCILTARTVQTKNGSGVRINYLPNASSIPNIPIWHSIYHSQFSIFFERSPSTRILYWHLPSTIVIPKHHPNTTSGSHDNNWGNRFHSPRSFAESCIMG
jgi:hypothetical protein